MKNIFSLFAFLGCITLFSCKTKNDIETPYFDSTVTTRGIHRGEDLNIGETNKSLLPDPSLIIQTRVFTSPKVFENAIAYLRENGNTDMYMVDTTNVQYSLRMESDSVITVNAMWFQSGKGLQVYRFQMTAEKLVSMSMNMVPAFVFELVFLQIKEEKYVTRTSKAGFLLLFLP